MTLEKPFKATKKFKMPPGKFISVKLKTTITAPPNAEFESNVSCVDEKSGATFDLINSYSFKQETKV